MNVTDYQPWHSLYCRLSGLNIPWSMQRLYQWEQFTANGYTQSDLAMVIKHNKKKISQKQKHPGSLSFFNTVGNLDRFAEDLAEAKAERRAWVDPNRAFVLRATGRPERELPYSVPIKSVMDKLITDLRRAVE